MDSADLLQRSSIQLLEPLRGKRKPETCGECPVIRLHVHFQTKRRAMRNKP